MPAFDAYLMVDWSGASVPVRGADSIWIAHARRSGGSVEIDRALHPVKDAAQVLGMVRALAMRDAAGDLAAELETPRRLPAARAARCLGEEGWILGA